MAKTVQLAAAMGLVNVAIDGGMAMMPHDTYDWSPRYAWVQDRYGLTRQLTQGRMDQIGAAIVPSLMYVTERPVAEAAMQRYTAVFEDARVIAAHDHPPGSPGPEGGAPAAQQCGWAKDAYGVPWQVAPRELSEMLSGADPETAYRVTNAFLRMKKFDLEAFREAYRR